MPSPGCKLMPNRIVGVGFCRKKLPEQPQCPQSLTFTSRLSIRSTAVPTLSKQCPQGLTGTSEERKNMIAAATYVLFLKNHLLYGQAILFFQFRFHPENIGLIAISFKDQQADIRAVRFCDVVQAKTRLYIAAILRQDLLHVQNVLHTIGNLHTQNNPFCHSLPPFSWNNASSCR